MEPRPNFVICEPGSRPGTFIYHDGNGYYYRFNNETIGSIFFKCVHSTCRGRAVLHIAEAFLHTQRHNHPCNPLLHEIRSVRRDIVARARSVRYVSFVDIVEEVRRRIPNRAIRQELTYRRLRSAMQRARASVFPPLPATLLELTAILQNPEWQGLTRTHDLEDIIYSGSVTAGDGSHCIIFVTQRGLQMLREVPVIFVDGTFKITPAIDGCYQILTIVTILGHTVIPLVWCLMERKSESAYTALFLHLRARLLHWVFRIVISDFEDAIINAVEAVFGVLAQGCFFHYVNAIGSWAKCNMSQLLLLTYPQLAYVVRLCSALPLLPQHLLQYGFNVIDAYAQTLGLYLYMLIHPFLVFVQTQWLNHANRGRTLSVCGSEHRTNNASESNNRRMGRRIGVNHPNVFQFVSSIVDFEDTAVDDIVSLRHGIIPSRHRTSAAVSNDATIQMLTTALLHNPALDDHTLFNFLHAAAYSMKNVMNAAMGFPENWPN